MKPEAFHGELSPQGAEAVSEQLDILLSDIQVHYQNLRSLHWDNHLRVHLDLNSAISQLYQDVDQGQHVVAERILELGYRPTNMEREALVKARLQPVDSVDTFEDAILLIINNSKALLQTLREVFDVATSFHDHETMSMLSEMGKYVHHTIWLFSMMRLARMN